MIFETELEKKAFEFICDYASDRMCSAGCNDLDADMVDLFKGQTIPVEDVDELIQSEITSDFDIIHWLKRQEK